MPNFYLSKLILLLAVVLTAFIGGLAGLVSVLIVLAMLYFLGGLDSESKHGISEHQSCRLGGVILVVYPACAVLFQWYVERQAMFTPSGRVLMLGCFGFFILGLLEDLTSALSPRLRLFLMISGAAMLLVLVPDMRLLPFDIQGVGWALEFPLAASLLTVISLTFIVNAFNVADGANGLVSGISLLALGGLMITSASVQVWPLELFFVSCLIFFCLNVLTGRLFLGDGGAYLLGLVVGTSIIFASNKTDVSPWFLGMLIFYPTADFFFSIVRRLVTGGSAMSADNRHFHNLVFALLKRAGLSPQLANTLTGISIAILWTGSAIALEIHIGDDINWMLVYALSWLSFITLWWCMRSLSARWIKEPTLS